ncbi:hypothetical protein FRE64_16040 [Euhalothece natronophila Z-M001]|uniref:Uncharacterized protein n=1 Tax=Euhalothece natronophila Z-M001 TaxID=522448 RepID=A0A5B8NQT1_9CHRO|nr:hypothetical protein [Euhalothece natronophila]QDZ41317.1 hypothetical protein FRE64_16040 [Euhalothece natronophila Z-M001]
MKSTEIKQRIAQSLDQLNPEKLIVVEKVVREFATYFNSEPLVESSSENNEQYDPLARLRNSDFICCFGDDSDLAEKSEKVAWEFLSKRETD